MTAFDNIIQRLANRELILPFFDLQFRADEWPEHYTVRVDTSPYYGRGDGYFHPSTHGLMGARQLYYEFHPDHKEQLTPERRDISLDLAAGAGSAMHAIIQTQLKMAGMLRPENIEKEFIDEVNHVRGRVDMLVDHPNHRTVLCEIKTRTPFKFSKTTELMPKWEAQTSIQLDNMGMERGVLLMVEMGWPFRMKELPAVRNDELLKKIYGKFRYVRQCIEDNTPPPPCCQPESDEMKACPARFLCWKHPDPEMRP